MLCPLPTDRSELFTCPSCVSPWPWCLGLCLPWSQLPFPFSLLPVHPKFSTCLKESPSPRKLLRATPWFGHSSHPEDSELTEGRGSSWSLKAPALKSFYIKYIGVFISYLLLNTLCLFLPHCSARTDERTALTLIKIGNLAWPLCLLRRHFYLSCLLLHTAPSWGWHKSAVFPWGRYLFLLCLDSSHIVESVNWGGLFALWKCYQMLIS